MTNYATRSQLVCAVIGLLVMSLLTASQARADHSRSVQGNYWSPPNFYFNGNSSRTDNSQLALWVTSKYNGNRIRVWARSGSGNGSTNDCATNQGWLPNGTYGRGDGDSNSRVDHMVKTWGNTTVRGNVWFLDSKWCGNKYRTELFIHSSGAEGTGWDGNWKTQGCIKISQHARNSYDGFTDYARDIAHERNNERLTVWH